MDAAGLSSSEIPQIFSRNLRQIDPSLNDDLLDLYGRSEQALANHFTFLNHSEKFEAEIDWECNAGPAWRNELHAFDYALNLALTYRISREERYARHLRYLIAHWIAANPPVEGTGWLLSPLARRVRNWILAADLARDDWERDREFLEMAGKSLALQSTYLYRHAGTAGPGPQALDFAQGLKFAGMFFGGSRGADFCSVALAMLRSELEDHVLPDGGYIEPLPTLQLHLAATAMEFLLLEAAAEKAHVFEEKLRQILSFLESILLPDGTLPLFGPSAGSSADALADVFALAAVRFREPAWKALAGRFGILPYMLLGEAGKDCFERLRQLSWQARNCLLPQSSLYRLSGAESSAMVINGHPTFSPEHHQDFLSYELAIGGQRVIVDSGAFSPEGESSSDFFCSASAHNVLLVDGQAPRPAASEFSLPQPHLREPGSGSAGVHIENRGFAFLGLNHKRTWFCLDHRIWVILDRLEGGGSHHSVNLLHFYPTFKLELGDHRAIARSRASAFTVIPLGRPDATMKVSQGDEGEYPGWYAPDCGLKYPTSVLALEWRINELPWVGGYIIFPGAEATFHAGETAAHADEICFEISGKQYGLPIR